MRTHIMTVLLVGSAVYAAVAVFAHLLHFAAYPVGLADTLVSCVGVVFPYGLLWVAHRNARDRPSRWFASVSVAVAALFAVIAYGDSFRARTVPDMYSIIYVAVPVVQSALAIVVLGVIAWRNRLRRQVQ